MFADIIKELRHKKGVSQIQLAKAIGVSNGNIGDWERGRSKPGYDALVSLSQFFNVSPGYLLGLPTEKPNNQNTSLVLKCDGVPLSEAEIDLLAMYRLIDDADKQTVFEITKLKYDLMTGKKVSIYSTYTDEKYQQEIADEICVDSAKGTA